MAVRVARGNVLLLLLAASGGCLGAPSDSRETSNEPLPLVASDPRFDTETCAVYGFVLDDEGMPLVGAQVEPLGTSLSALTDAAGRFAFNYLAPGNYQVTASMWGHEARTLLVACEAGQSSDPLQITLPRLPEPSVPYSRVYIHRGKIGCAVGIGSAETVDFCRKDSLANQGIHNPELVQGANATFRLFLDSGTVVTSGMYELAWVRASAFGSEYLVLRYPLPAKDAMRSLCPTTEAYGLGGVVRGKSTLCVQLVAYEDEPLHRPTVGSYLDFEVRPSGQIRLDAANATVQDHSSKLLFDQSFDLYVTLFYNQEPIPVDYTAVGS